jgi:hypothetical protein
VDAEAGNADAADGVNHQLNYAQYAMGALIRVFVPRKRAVVPKV